MPVRGAAREARRAAGSAGRAQYQDPDFAAGQAVLAKKNRQPRGASTPGCSGTRAQQLDARAARARSELGMPVGLYVDLALGADRGGAEVWADQRGVRARASHAARRPTSSIRAARTGACRRTRRARCARRATARSSSCCAPTCREGGALRMDHVMALSRLYWIPRGAQARPRRLRAAIRSSELLAVLAQESRARRCLVIGEDLGTVPAELRDALNDAGVLSYRPLLSRRTPTASAPPQAYPRDALVCVSTHDLPTWRGYWAEHDLELRDKLGLTVDAEKEQRARASRQGDARARARARRPRHARRARRARLHRAHALQARAGAARGRVRARRAGEPARHGRRASELAAQAAARARALAEPIRGSRRSPQRWRERGGARRRARPTSESPSPPTACSSTRASASRDATALVPYLARLGVSHVYASPFLKARPGSMHGYDVVDHDALNPEIGTEAELRRLLDALRSHGMGLVLDIVPNHMGVLHARQPLVAGRAREGPRVAVRASSSTSTGSARQACCCRCSAGTTARRSRRARSSSAQGKDGRVAACATTTTASRSTPRARAN